MSKKIQLRQRKFKAGFARAIAQRIYEKPIHNATWTNWRKWVGCSGHWVTGDQLVELLAIAQVRLQFPRKELVRDEDIQPVLFEVSMKLLNLIHDIDSGYVMGHDALNYLQSFHQSKVSRVLLYQVVPGFSTRKPYQKRLLLQSFGIPA